MVNNGASSHKTNYVDILSEILNPEGHQNCYIGSKVTANLLNGYVSILPTGVCVYPFSREGGINLFGDHRGSILSNRAEISQEG